MALTIDLQNDDGISSLPQEVDFQRWIAAALQHSFASIEQTIRVVGEAESRALNLQYRGKDSATNVLSFPSDAEYLDYECLGDLVICAPVVADEAKAQGKSGQAHWAHLVIHGMLHLQGFDHGNDVDAAQMEALEIKILSTLGYTNPYNDSLD